MEYMDGGSFDKLHGAGVPECVLARIAASTTRGLKFLKDDLNIIHRGRRTTSPVVVCINYYADVKPTNVLVNKRGQVKLCDFGVSGELNKSLAKTNIGCQSYMAVCPLPLLSLHTTNYLCPFSQPERIKGESRGESKAYTVSSDVWSLGLSIIEIALGQYPYPPETYENVFVQLQAIVNGDPPELPDERYSEVARDWVSRCMRKDPERRASYKDLLVCCVYFFGMCVDFFSWTGTSFFGERCGE
jgi:mitogen-activated protein kinase kinase